MPERPLSVRSARWRGADWQAWALLGLGLAFGTAFTWLNVLKLRSFFFFEFEDAAVEGQLLFNLATSGRFVQTLFHTGLPDHFWPVAYLIAPFYALHPSLETWYALVSFSYGFCAVPFYLIARDLAGSKRIGLAVGLAYLAYAPMHYLALGGVDGGRNFALPALAAAVYFMHAGSLRGYCAAALVACMCKEDMPFVVAALGVYQAWKGMPRRWWLSSLLGAGAYFAVALVLLSTVFTQWPREREVRVLGGIFYLDAQNFRHFAEMFAGHFRESLSYLFHPSKVRALLLSLWPLAFLPFGAAELLIALPSVAELLLARVRFFNQNSDYLAPVVPLLFFALAHALARIKRLRSERAAAAAAWAVVALCASQHFTRSVLGCTARESGVLEDVAQADRRFEDVVSIFDRRLYRVDEEDRLGLALAGRIPREASVTASGSFLPLLSGRRVLREFGFAKVYKTKEAREAEEARAYASDFVLIDRKCRTNGLGGRYPCPEPDEVDEELRRLRTGFGYRVIEDDGTFALLSRGAR